MSSMPGATRIRVFLLLLLHTFCAAEFQIKNDRRSGMEFNHSANVPFGDDGVIGGALLKMLKHRRWLMGRINSNAPARPP